MGVLKCLGAVCLLLLSLWPLMGSCNNSTMADYTCGEEGVQLRVPPDYLGGEVAFQIRDEFNMGYDLHGCISKCLLSTRLPNGEMVFYIPYTICLSVRKTEGEWLFRVRLVGGTKSEDLDLICPKPKHKRPRVMTPRPRTTRRPTFTAVYPMRTTPHTTLGGPAVTRIPLEISADRSTTIVIPGGNVTAKPTDVLREMPVTTPKGPLVPPQCKVPKEKLPCLNSTVSQDTCVNHRCCHDPKDPVSPCYYGNTVTVHCFLDGLFQLILSRYVTTPPLRLSSVVLGPGTCPPPTILGNYLEYKGNLSLCSARRFVQGHLMYELSLTAKPDVLVSPLGSITRDSSLMVLSQCLYNNTLTNVSLVVLAPQPPTVTSTGVLSVELRISKGSAFSSFYTSEDFPIQIPLRELVYLEARLLQPSDPRLHLRLHHCWGAPNMDPTLTVRWPVINDGCPFSDDDMVTQILPGSVPSSYQRFAVSAFTFVNLPYETQVYFFCSVSVCLPSPSESCITDCTSVTRSRRSHLDDSLYLVATAGPLVFEQDKKLGLAGLHHLTVTVPGIVLAVTFLLIILLAAALKVRNCFMSPL